MVDMISNRVFICNLKALPNIEICVDGAVRFVDLNTSNLVTPKNVYETLNAEID